MVGGNFRIDALQAAVISVKLNYLDNWTEGRQKNAQDYISLINENSLSAKVQTPIIREGYRHIFNQFILSVPDRDELVQYLKSKNVGCEIYYPVALHNQECFTYLGYHDGDFPISEQATKNTIAIPIYPELTIAQKKYVIDNIKDFYA